MNRIERKFKELKRSNKKAFIAFITAGYPSLEITKQLVREFTRIGVDIIELGVPFSDPLADGPIIQEASRAALKKGVHLEDILDLVEQLRRQIDTPICLMSYYNPIFCFGEARLIRRAKKAGVDGFIIPDLTPEEGRSFIAYAGESDLDTIFFVSPTTIPKRIKFIDRVSRGFIYYISLTGVTGPRQRLPEDLIDNLKQVKRYTKKPVCVGFGISHPSQIKKINRMADGVIVGSAIVKKIQQNIYCPDLVKRVTSFVRSLMA